MDLRRLVGLPSLRAHLLQVAHHDSLSIDDLIWLAESCPELPDREQALLLVMAARALAPRQPRRQNAIFEGLRDGQIVVELVQYTKTHTEAIRLYGPLNTIKRTFRPPTSWLLIVVLVVGDVHSVHVRGESFLHEGNEANQGRNEAIMVTVSTPASGEALRIRPVESEDLSEQIFFVFPAESLEATSELSALDP